VARPRLFTAAQVREWRRVSDLRRSLPSDRQQALKAGIHSGHFAQIVNREIYKDVR
jgi:hypothetical protein